MNSKIGKCMIWYSLFVGANKGIIMTNIIAIILVTVITNTIIPEPSSTREGIWFNKIEKGTWVKSTDPNTKIVEITQARDLVFTFEDKTYCVPIDTTTISKTKYARKMTETWEISEIINLKTNETNNISSPTNNWWFKE